MTQPMTLAEVQAEIDALAAMMVEKGCGSPDAEASLRAGSDPQVVLYSEPFGTDWGSSRYKFFRADDIRDALANARAFVDALPTGEENAIREYMDAVGAAIGIGALNSIAEEYVAPLRLTRKAISDNLLTAQAAE